MNDIDKIKRIACDITGVDRADIETKSRKGMIPFTKQLVMYALNNLTRLPYQNIAALAGYKGKQRHASAIHAIGRIHSLLDVKQHPEAAMIRLFEDAIGHLNDEYEAVYKGQVTSGGLLIIGRGGLTALYKAGWLTITRGVQTLFDQHFANKDVESLVKILNHFNKPTQ